MKDAPPNIELTLLTQLTHRLQAPKDVFTTQRRRNKPNVIVEQTRPPSKRTIIHECEGGQIDRNLLIKEYLLFLSRGRREWNHQLKA
ncbi:unnamed protein product [Dovyalis caffra]|uniref:Uncharacterized protein n=1 Tax=Dovyalis caffra TaxID=77055 RepID=A0AAV1RYA1_9ROSI|nr:unnamed protein product [Dovyalis caffra]